MSPSRRRLSPWLVLLVVAAAAAANATHLRRWWRRPTAAAPPPHSERDGSPAAEPTAAAAPPEVATTFAPVLDGDGLQDPFLHAAAAPPVAATPVTPSAPPVPPRVTLILRAAGSRRAQIDGALVREGDRTRHGIVREILTDRVVIETPSGARVVASLAALVSAAPAPAGGNPP